MATSKERLDQLQAATLLCAYDHKLVSSGKGMVGWGLFTFVIGYLMVRQTAAGWLNIGFGILLVIVGLYEIRERQPIVIKVAALTLALLAAWNLGLFAVALIFQIRIFGLSHGLLAGIVQTFAAHSVWRSYALYEALHRSADAATVQEMVQLIEGVKNRTVESTQFKASGDEEEFWNVCFQDDLAFFLRLGGLFGRNLKVREAFWIRRDDLRVEHTGDKWGKDMIANIHLAGETVIKKATMSPDAFQRLSS